MKKIMKVVSLILTFAILASMVIVPNVATYAVPAGTAKLTLNSPSDNIKLTGREFTLYRIFDIVGKGEESDTYAWNANLTGEELGDVGTSEVAKFRTELIKILNQGHSDEHPVEESATITEIIQHLGDDHKNTVAASEGNLPENDDLEGFAKRLKTWLTTPANSTIADKLKVNDVTGTNSGSSIVYDKLPFGYYLIVESTKSVADDSIFSALILANFDKDETVNLKASLPTLDKTVQKIESASEGATSASYSGGNAAAIGDTIQFKLETKVPDVFGYDQTSYEFSITDTLSKGLDVVTDGTSSNKAKVTVYYETAVEGSTEVLDSGNYTVTGPTAVDGDAHTIKIEFSNEWLFNTAVKNRDITIVYSAVINNKALIGATDPTTNSAVLTYSNNPEDTSSKGNTPSETTNTYTFGLNLTKQSSVATDAGKKLEGAKFKLKCVAGANKDKYASTVSSPTGTGNDTTANASGDLDTNKAPLGANVQTIQSWTDETTATRFVTDKNGNIFFYGLGEGTYTLIEVESPNKYYIINKEITFTVDPAYSGEGNKTLSTLTMALDKAYDAVPTSVAEDGATTSLGATTTTGYGNITVLNTDVATLPETGGMGTTLLYTIGGALVVIAGILLISKKRMHAAR